MIQTTYPDDGINTYKEIAGMLRQTSQEASPFSYFSCTRKYGLREMWDAEHAAYYQEPVKHHVSDYIKPCGLRKTTYDGSIYLRCALYDLLGELRFVDIHVSLLNREHIVFLADMLQSLFGYKVYNNLHFVWMRALTIERLEPYYSEVGPDNSSGSESTDGMSLSAVAVYQEYAGVIINESGSTASVSTFEEEDGDSSFTGSGGTFEEEEEDGSPVEDGSVPILPDSSHVHPGWKDAVVAATFERVSTNNSYQPAYAVDGDETEC